MRGAKGLKDSLEGNASSGLLVHRARRSSRDRPPDPSPGGPVGWASPLHPARTPEVHLTRAPPPQARAQEPTASGAQWTSSRPSPPGRAPASAPPPPRRTAPAAPRTPKPRPAPGARRLRLARRPGILHLARPCAPPRPRAARSGSRDRGAGWGRERGQGGSAGGRHCCPLLVTRSFSALYCSQPTAPDPAVLCHVASIPDHEPGPGPLGEDGQIPAENL